MPEETSVTPVWGYELEDWIEIDLADDTKEWVKATELLTWDEESENTEYTPSWLDRKSQPTFIMAQSSSISWEKDTVRGGELDGWAMRHRNDVDVPCRVCRVYTWEGTPDARTADCATYLFTPNRMNKSNAGQPTISGGTLNRSSDGNTEGTWNSTTKVFIEGAAAGGAEG